MLTDLNRFLRSFELRHNVKILFSCELGSRTWGLDSPASDYDIKIVFSRPISDYFTLKEPDDVIREYFNKDYELVEVKDCEIEIEAYDIRKYLSLMMVGNPNVIEWTIAPKYSGDISIEVKDFIRYGLNWINTYKAYRGMAEGNYVKYIKSNNDVTCKRYLYCVRGILNARYIFVNKTMPPLKYEDLLGYFKSKKLVSESIITELRWLADLKRANAVDRLDKRIEILDKFIESELEDRPELKDELPKNVYLLDHELKRVCLDN